MPTLETLTIRFAPARRTIAHLLRDGAERHGHRPLLSIGGQTWSHADMVAQVARRAATLATQGITTGNAVAILCRNRLEILESVLACAWLGAIAVPINVASRAPQVQYFLANSGARLLLAETSLADALVDVDWTTTRVEALWWLPDGDTAPPTLPGFTGASQACPAGAEPIDPADAGPGTPFAILYTSGTTGPSKGVISPQAQWFWWGAHSVDALDIGPDDVLATTLPLFHVNALHTFIQASLSGAHVVYHRRFSASRFWPEMRQCGATRIYLLGAMVPILLAQPEQTVEREHRVRLALSPGTPADAARRLEARTGVRVIEGYGSTETNFAIATTAAAPPDGRMGWVRPGFDARVVDEDDTPVPAGVAGELLLRADEPYAFALGYHDMPDATVAAWRNLWLHTGDRVVADADGALRFLDRIKDAIRRRGENISSYEVEAALLEHPAVAEAAVFPVPSELAEDDVMAAIRLRPGSQPGHAELIEFCRARLPRFAVPRYLDIVDDFPRTANGKVRKVELRERGVTATTWRHD
ncbi:MAG: ATP-dependent acyl-CoA ligase [Pigmentiphaga sp.]|nr:ATP-dependent acyl-CoA ligase [Pigmentiphaga sp.]